MHSPLLFVPFPKNLVHSWLAPISVSSSTALPRTKVLHVGRPQSSPKFIPCRYRGHSLWTQNKETWFEYSRGLDKILVSEGAIQCTDRHVLSPPKDKVDLPVFYTLHAEGRFSNSLTSCVIEVLSNFGSNFSYILFYVLVLCVFLNVKIGKYTRKVKLLTLEFISKFQKTSTNSGKFKLIISN